MGFQIALENVILTILYIIPGYLICKFKKASADNLSIVSTILIYICSPCMIINAFMSLDFTVDSLLQMGLFFIVTLVLQGLFMLILYLILRKKYEMAKYRMLTISSVLGNVGFFGMPVIKALFPNLAIVLCYSSIYVISMNVLVFTIGVFCLTNDKKYMSVKSIFLNPASISIFVALPIYIFNVKEYTPAILQNAIALVGNMTTPVCMFILGIRLAAVEFKKLFLRPFIYLACLLKLLIFPLFCFLIIYFIPFDNVFKASVLVLSSTPCASVILNLAEMHHKEQELSANCVLFSTLICFLTIPLMTMLVM